MGGRPVARDGCAAGGRSAVGRRPVPARDRSRVPARASKGIRDRALPRSRRRDAGRGRRPGDGGHGAEAASGGRADPQAAAGFAACGVSEIHTVVSEALIIDSWSFGALAAKVRFCFTNAADCCREEVGSVCALTGNGRELMSNATCGVLSARTVAVSGRATEAPPPSAVLSRHTHRALDFGRDTVATGLKPSTLRRDVRLERIDRTESPICPFLAG